MTDNDNIQRPQKRPGRGGNILPDTDKLFSKNNQPTSEAKKAGWLKKKRSYELVKAVLDLSFKGKKNTVIKKQAALYFGVSEDDITMEVMLIFKQVEKAIQKADTPAFNAVMDRAFGKPKEKMAVDPGESFLDFLKKSSAERRAEREGSNPPSSV
jgi:hypothetical protein